MKSLRDRYWPRVSDITSARGVARRAAWVAIVTAGALAFLAVLALLGIPMVRGIDGWALIDAAVWGAVAAGIWRMSRAAAVTGLAVTLAVHVFLWDREVGMTYLIATIVIVLAFLNALRATFAYHRFRKPTPTAIAPEPVEPL